MRPMPAMLVLISTRRKRKCEASRRRELRMQLEKKREGRSLGTSSGLVRQLWGRQAEPHGLHVRNNQGPRDVPLDVGFPVQTFTSAQSRTSRSTSKRSPRKAPLAPPAVSLPCSWARSSRIATQACFVAV